MIGGFRLSQDGCALQLSSGAQRLVAYVALQPRTVGRDQAAGALWLDAREARAHANLRSALWRIRREADGLISAENGTLALGSDVAVDVRTILDRARALFTDSAVDDVDLGLFAGELLPDWFDDWVLAERERVRQVCLHGLDRLAALFLARKQYPQAIDAALLAIRVDALRESSQRVLLEIHLAEGNRSEAIREFERYKALLWEELQIEPSRNLRELVAVTVR
jgi:DNA-binding SARP family transcriptional activator